MRTLDQNSSDKGDLVRAVVLGVVVTLVAVPALAQDIGLEIRAIYSFAPHELTSQEIEEKTRVLDSFWAKAKAQQDLPARYQI